MQHLAAIERDLTLQRHMGDFVGVCRCLMLAKGNLREAANLAEAQRASPRVREVLKSAIDAGAYAIGSWGTQLAAFQLLVSGFVNALQSVGVFDQLFLLKQNQHDQLLILECNFISINHQNT